jgi:hypothetical protein
MEGINNAFASQARMAEKTSVGGFGDEAKRK